MASPEPGAINRRWRLRTTRRAFTFLAASCLTGVLMSGGRHRLRRAGGAMKATSTMSACLSGACIRSARRGISAMRSGIYHVNKGQCCHISSTSGTVGTLTSIISRCAASFPSRYSPSLTGACFGESVRQVFARNAATTCEQHLGGVRSAALRPLPDDFNREPSCSHAHVGASGGNHAWGCDNRHAAPPRIWER